MDIFLLYDDDLSSNDSNGDYNGSSNDQSALEESLSDSSSSSGRNIEVHHPNEENGTFKDNTSYDAYDSQLNSDENSQEGTIDDESTTIQLEVITGADDEDSIVPSEPTGVGVDKKSSLNCDSDHDPSDDSEGSLVEEQHPTLSDEIEEAMQAGATAASDEKTLPKHQRNLMFLKEKCSGALNVHGCADGRPQRLYKTKHKTSSPTVSLKALFLTCLVDIMEGCCVMTADIPGAFMQADIDKQLFIKLEGDIALLLIREDPSYQKCMTYKKKKAVIYAELSKVLYRTLQATLLFWRELSQFLKGHGFTANPYDPCVVNKVINGKQCMVAWHVDNLKMSHVEQQVLEELLNALNAKFGKEKPLTVTHGKTHEYLRMTIYRKVKFITTDFVDGIISETSPELLKAAVQTPAALHLFEVNEKGEKLEKEQWELFHNLVAKLLYQTKRS